VNIALTGTPGTGKTSLAIRLEHNIVSINNHYPEISNGKDEEGNWLIDLKKLNKVISVKKDSSTIFEGHVSHFLKGIEMTIVLRCNPKNLNERLKSRGYTKEKIKENMEAEALNIISEEAIEICGEKNVFELDTTNRSMEDSVKNLKDIINGNIKSDKRIDYSETIMDWY
tara:strand:+ start:115 stop:624 length:510 start_codon:yes stop_codon:yes gene_type:complete